MNSLFSFLDADAEAPSSRRDALGTVGKLGLGAALASVPFLTPQAARAQNNDANMVDVDMDGDFDAIDVLNYALTLEYLERSFYRQALDQSYLGSERPLIQQLADDEAAHVTVLRGAIEQAGGTPLNYEDADFDFGDFLASRETFLALAQSLEDTGVRAYKGQAPTIQAAAPQYLTTALQIHSVEGRHAAAIRRLRGNQGWIPNDQPGAPVPEVYGPSIGSGSFPSEANTTQGGVELVGALGYTAEQVSEAFDEGLDMTTVLSLVEQNGFISGTVNQDDDDDGNDND